MKAKLIMNPWVSDKLPEGLTLNKEYIVTEVFSANPYDEYYRILDDNNEEQSWNSELFEVTVKRPIDILNECIKELENMTEEEFLQRISDRGINKKDYSVRKYTDDTLQIILPYNIE